MQCNKQGLKTPMKPLNRLFYPPPYSLISERPTSTDTRHARTDPNPVQSYPRTPPEVKEPVVLASRHDVIVVSGIHWVPAFCKSYMHGMTSTTSTWAYRLHGGSVQHSPFKCKAPACKVVEQRLVWPVHILPVLCIGVACSHLLCPLAHTVVAA